MAIWTVLTKYGQLKSPDKDKPNSMKLFYHSKRVDVFIFFFELFFLLDLNFKLKVLQIQTKRIRALISDEWIPKLGSNLPKLG